MRPPIGLFAVSLSLALGACVHANVEYLSPQRFDPLPPDSVTVFLSVMELQADTIAYLRVAMIHLSGDQAFTNREKLFRKAREKAAEIGANGVVFGGVEEGSTSWNPLFGFTTSDRQGEAYAIRWWVRREEARKEDKKPEP